MLMLNLNNLNELTFMSNVLPFCSQGVELLVFGSCILYARFSYNMHEKVESA